MKELCKFFLIKHDVAFSFYTVFSGWGLYVGAGSCILLRCPTYQNYKVKSDFIRENQVRLIDNSIKIIIVIHARVSAYFTRTLRPNTFIWWSKFVRPNELTLC